MKNERMGGHGEKGRGTNSTTLVEQTRVFVSNRLLGSLDAICHTFNYGRHTPLFLGSHYEFITAIWILFEVLKKLNSSIRSYLSVPKKHCHILPWQNLD